MCKHLRKSKYKILSPWRGDTKADAAREDDHIEEVYASGKHGQSGVLSNGQQKGVRMFKRYCKQEQRNSGDNKAGTCEAHGGCQLDAHALLLEANTPSQDKSAQEWPLP